MRRERWQIGRHNNLPPKSMALKVLDMLGLMHRQSQNRGGTNHVFGKPCFCPLPKAKTAKMKNMHSTRWKQGLCSSDPRKRWKWRVSLRQRHGFFWESRVCSSLTEDLQNKELSLKDIKLLEYSQNRLKRWRRNWFLRIWGEGHSGSSFRRQDKKRQSRRKTEVGRT